MATDEAKTSAWPLRSLAPAIALPSGLPAGELRAAWTAGRAQQAAGIEMRLGDLEEARVAWGAEYPTDRPRLALRTRCATTRRSEAERILRDELLRASRAGAEVLNLHLPGLADDGASRGSFARYGEAWNFAYSLLRETRLDVEAAGVGIAVEVAVDDWLCSPVEARDLLDAVGSCAIGVCLDATRFRRRTAVYDWIDTLTRRIRFVRSPGAAGGDGMGRATERIGVELSAALTAAGYEGLVCLIEPGSEVSGKLA